MKGENQRMLWIPALVLGLIAIVAGLGLRAAAQQGRGGMGGYFSGPLLALGAVLIVLSPVLSAAVQVPPGHRGVVTFFGSVEDRVLGEGLSIIIPFAEQVVLVEVRVQPHTFTEIEASSQEYQTVRLTGTMNFHLDPAYVQELYQRVGLDFVDKVIDPA